MADVLKGVPDLPDDVFMFVYCDNIGVLAPRERISAIEELIRSAFRASGAGVFNLKDKGGRGAAPVSRPFRFLGMEFIRVSNRFVVRPPSGALDKATILKRGDILMAMDEATLEKARRSVLGTAAGWGLWPEVGVWRDALLADVDAQRGVLKAMATRQSVAS